MTNNRVGRMLLLFALLDPAVAAAAQERADPKGEAIRKAADRVGPAVVSIRTARNPFQNTSLHANSGFVVDAARGLVATTGAALFGGFQAEVILPDGAVLPARRVFHADPAGTLVLLQVDPPPAGLSAAELADGPRPDLGDEILAVGRSTEGRLLVSSGIAASSRDAGERDESAPFAVDVRIVAENAGGPIVDRDGRVVGLALPGSGPIFRPSREGFPSATPAARLRAAMASFRDDRGPSRSYLGVMLGPPPRLFGDPRPDAGGMMVTGVAPGSPAELARLGLGDRITAVDGRRVDDASDLLRAIEAVPVGGEVALTVLRGDEQLEIKVRTAPRPEAFLGVPLAPAPPPPADGLDSSVDRPDSEGSIPKNERNEGSDLPKPLP